MLGLAGSGVRVKITHLHLITHTHTRTPRTHSAKEPVRFHAHMTIILFIFDLLDAILMCMSRYARTYVCACMHDWPMDLNGTVANDRPTTHYHFDDDDDDGGASIAHPTAGRR